MNKLEEFQKQDNGSFKPLFDEMVSKWTHSNREGVSQNKADDFAVFVMAFNDLISESYSARFEDEVGNKK